MKTLELVNKNIKALTILCIFQYAREKIEHVKQRHERYKKGLNLSFAD